MGRLATVAAGLALCALLSTPAFAQAGGSLFRAKNSFDTIFGGRLGSTYGFGGQWVFPSGLFVQGAYERFRKTGSRVLVSGEQIFRLTIPDTLTVEPIDITLGYR